MSKGHRRQLKGASNIQIWDNLHIKINIVMDYKLLKKIGFTQT